MTIHQFIQLVIGKLLCLGNRTHWRWDHIWPELSPTLSLAVVVYAILMIDSFAASTSNPAHEKPRDDLTTTETSEEDKKQLERAQGKTIKHWNVMRMMFWVGVGFLQEAAFTMITHQE